MLEQVLELLAFSHVPESGLIIAAAGEQHFGIWTHRYGPDGRLVLERLAYGLARFGVPQSRFSFRVSFSAAGDERFAVAAERDSEYAPAKLDRFANWFAGLGIPAPGRSVAAGGRDHLAVRTEGGGIRPILVHQGVADRLTRCGV